VAGNKTLGWQGEPEGMDRIWSDKFASSTRNTFTFRSKGIWFITSCHWKANKVQK